MRPGGLPRLPPSLGSLPHRALVLAKKFQTAEPVSPTRAAATIGLFSALYIVAAGLAGYLFESGFAEHFIRGILMTGVILSTRRMWSATLMGLVSGIVFQLAVSSPAPYLLASTVASGLVFDLVLAAGAKSYPSAARSRRKLFLGAAVSGAAESVVALSILTAAGLFRRSAYFGFPVGVIWALDIALNIVLSIAGAWLVLRLLPRSLSGSRALQGELRQPSDQTSPSSSS
jgi:hypothetical protein